MAAAASRRIVERFLAEVLNGEHPASAPVLVADEMLRRRVESFRTAFPDLRVTTRRVVGQDALVAVHLIGSGTQSGAFQGCPPSGRTWEATCSAIYRVADGRIAEAWVNWDLLAILEQLGWVERAVTASA